MGWKLCAVPIAVLLFCAVCAQQSENEILDSCEESGGEIGKKNARVGCEAVKRNCSAKVSSRIAAPRQKSSQGLGDMVQGVIDRTCDTLFMSSCLRSALVSVDGLGDETCFDILTRGPGVGKDDCTTREKAVEIFRNALVECQNPCACSEDGVANGIQTNRAGCKKHLESVGDNDYFCYVVNSQHCTKEEITESMAYPGTYWILCGDSKESG